MNNPTPPPTRAEKLDQIADLLIDEEVRWLKDGCETPVTGPGGEVEMVTRRPTPAHLAQILRTLAQFGHRPSASAIENLENTVNAAIKTGKIDPETALKFKGRAIPPLSTEPDAASA